MGPRRFSRGKSAISAHRSGSARRFNGATAFQPWKGASPVTHVTLKRASMGPRRFSRGKSRTPVACGNGMRSFNGATALQPWKDVEEAQDLLEDAPKLQWGHGVSAVER